MYSLWSNLTGEDKMAKERFCFMDIHEIKDVINNKIRTKIHPIS